MRTIETSTTATVTNPEPWVDLKGWPGTSALAMDTSRRWSKLARSQASRSSAASRPYWRFKLSAVDAFLEDSNVEG